MIGHLIWNRHGVFAKFDRSLAEITELTFQLRRVRLENYPTELFGGTLKFDGETIDKEVAKENWRELLFPDMANSENEFEQGSEAVLVRPEFVNREEQLGSVSFQIPTGNDGVEK